MEDRPQKKYMWWPQALMNEPEKRFQGQPNLHL